MAQRSGINRGLMWLRKSLEITEETESPRVLSEILQPTIDTFGWERLGEAITVRTAAGGNPNSVSSPAVPNDVLRLLLAASVDTSDLAGGFTLWIEVRNAAGFDLGLTSPVLVPLSTLAIRVPLLRPVVLRPGDVLRGRSSDNIGVGNLTLTEVFVDIPGRKGGEYVPPV